MINMARRGSGVWFAHVCTAFVVLMSLMAGAVDTGRLREIDETMAKIRMTASSNARADSGEYLAQLTKEINPDDIDDRTLSDLISLLDISDESMRSWVATSLGNLGPRAKEAASGLLKIVRKTDCVPVMGGFPSSEAARAALERIGEVQPVTMCKATVDPADWNRWTEETIANVRTSEFPGVRAMAAQNLAYQTFWLGPKDIDERNVAGIVSLLDIPEEPLRDLVARSLGHIGPRARAAIPKLKALLTGVDCHEGGDASTDNIRYALRRMGVKHAPAKCGSSGG